MLSTRYTHKQSGFTLLELLVVTAIIGILAMVVLASLSDARATARDTARVAGVREVQKALELYYIEHGGYPTQAFPDNLSVLATHLVPDYLPSISYDMSNVSGPTYYAPAPNTYLIYVSLEAETQSSPVSHGCKTGMGPALTSGLYPTSPFCPWE